MSHLITGNTVDRFILREYIGVKPYPKSFIFPDIDYNEIDFHVILAFAHETYNEDGKGTGKFYPDWDLDICGIPRVQDIKLKYPKVKVVLSIGGRDIQSVQDIIKHKDPLLNILSLLLKKNPGVIMPSIRSKRSSKTTRLMALIFSMTTSIPMKKISPTTLGTL
jgi:hypothetical protein